MSAKALPLLENYRLTTIALERLVFSDQDSPVEQAGKARVSIGTVRIIEFIAHDTTAFREAGTTIGAATAAVKST